MLHHHLVSGGLGVVRIWAEVEDGTGRSDTAVVTITVGSMGALDLDVWQE